MKKCMMELGNGHKCQRIATVTVGGLAFCNQHAKQAKSLFRSNVKVTKIEK